MAAAESAQMAGHANRHTGLGRFRRGGGNQHGTEEPSAHWNVIKRKMPVACSTPQAATVDQAVASPIDVQLHMLTM